MRFFARHDTLIAIIGTAVLTACYYWCIVCPGRTSVQTIEQEIARSHARMGEIPAILAERSQLQSRLTRQREQVDRMELVLPSDSHVSDVLHQVASLARKSNLIINRLEPLPTVEFPSYSSHPFHLSCRGEFQDMAGFLNGLETQSRLVTFGSVDLTRGSEGQSPSVGHAIQANINFSVYSRHAKSTKLAENTISPRG